MTTPIISPAEAISIALNVTPRLQLVFGPESRAVKNVLDALDKAGWDVVPKDRKKECSCHESPARADAPDSVNHARSK